MNPDDRQHRAELDRYWDALALTGNPPEESSLDRETAALITRPWAATAPPQPGMARERVWRQLEQRGEEARDMEEVTVQMPSLTLARMFGPNGRSSLASVPPVAQSRWRMIPSFLVTAAILVLALAAGLFASGSLPETWRSAEPPALPALLVATPLPATAGTTAATLLDLTLPADLLPRGDRVSSIFEFATSPAGSTGSWLAVNSAGQPGLRVQHLLEGEITVRAEGASLFVPAGGAAPEDVAADTEITLGPGDTWVARNETVFEASNPTDAPARLLVWVLANVEDPGGVINYPLPGMWTEEVDVLDQPAPGEPGIDVPAGAARLRLQRIALEPKESYPPAASGLQYGLASPFGADGSPVVGPSVASQPSGKIVNIGRKAATAYVLQFAPAEDVGTPSVEVAP